MTTYSTIAKNTTTYTASTDSSVVSALLLEDGFYFLLEDGGKLVLEQSVAGTIYTPITKN